ncbi:MAG: phage tail protein [Pseudanabaena frigida]|uniref:Phage tail protein n=1 Tax=Pseudanabaena frigida TaxID=945775 RepID=A0A2W4VXD8_9CYAN|nr:MAG: phage tail protein [Pseudanabaena frigida]
MATESQEQKIEILASSKFYVEITLQGSLEKIDGYFMECSGLSRSQEVIEIVEVTPQVWGKAGSTKGRVLRTKIPGQVKSDNIVLKQGLNISMTMWKWLKAVEDGDWSLQLRDGDITIYDQSQTEQARFRFNGAWPIRYKISDFKADSSEFAITEVELCVRDFLRVDPMTQSATPTAAQTSGTSSAPASTSR